jgi:hypothetical protein
MVLEDFICFKFQKRPYELYRMEVQNCGRCLCNPSQSVICLASVGNLICLNKRIFPPEFLIYYEIKNRNLSINWNWEPLNVYKVQSLCEITCDRLQHLESRLNSQLKYILFSDVEPSYQVEIKFYLFFP